MYQEIPKIRKETSLKTVPGFGLTVDLRSTAGRLGKWTGGWVPVACRSTGREPWAPDLAGRLPVDWSKPKS